MPQIECKNISLGYDGRTIAEALSFTVAEGDYLCVVGENGAGKSTLVKTLLGLNKPMAGEISYGSGLARKEIGYLPQQAELQRDFPASVWEIVISGCINSCKKRCFFDSKAKRLAADNIKKLGIEDLKKRCYRELSGGQQQRVLLARALCAAKKLLLLDEPAAGLDPMATDELYHLIMELNMREGITVIMVSHDVKAAVSHAKHILHLGNGMYTFGTAAEYAESEVGKLFLGQNRCRRCNE